MSKRTEKGYCLLIITIKYNAIINRIFNCRFRLIPYSKNTAKIQHNML